MGMWGMSIGGTGDDYGYDVALTSAGGIVIGGSTYSDSIDLGGVAVNNLQHARSEAASGTDAVQFGQRAMFVAGFAATESPPSCVTCGPSGLITDAATTISAGAASPTASATRMARRRSAHRASCAMQPTRRRRSRARTRPTTATSTASALTRAPMAPRYRRYHQDSVCEQCQPSVNPLGFSVMPGFIHDRVIADLAKAVAAMLVRGPRPTSSG